MLLKEFKDTIFPLKDKLFRFARQFVVREDEAADIVQDTFLKLWIKKDSLHEVRNPETFAMTMVKNASIDRLRKRKTLRLDEIKKDPLDAFTPLDSLTNTEAYNQVLHLIQSLSQQQQMLINLRDVEGYTYTEIAEISGLSINTIRVNISRARQIIRNKILKQEENEELRNGTIA